MFDTPERYLHSVLDFCKYVGLRNGALLLMAIISLPVHNAFSVFLNDIEEGPPILCTLPRRLEAS